MIKVKGPVILALFALCLATEAAAQDTPVQADVRISRLSTSTASNYQCRITVATDLPANNVTVIALMPPSLEISGLPGGPRTTCTKSMLTSDGANAFVMCPLGNLPANTTMFIPVTGNLRDPTVVDTACSAFVLSQTPDSNRMNNFAPPVR